MIIRQPDNTEFLLCWKGKYIVGITHVPAEQHFNVRYEYDNNAVIAHDFFADDPYPGVLTIEASESSDPTPVADFETALRAFLPTIGVSNVALSRVTQLEWWNTNAAFYEVPVLSLMRLTNANDDTCLGIKYGDQVIAPKFTIGGLTGYLPFDSAGIVIHGVTPSCPQDSSLFSGELMQDALVPVHTDVPYGISVESCDVSGGVEIVISPISGNYPSIRAKGFWRNGNLEFVYYKNQLVAIDKYDYSDITVGHAGYVVANLVPCRITKLSATEATLEVSEIGSPNNAPFYRYVTVNNVSYFSDLYVLDDYDDFGEYDIESQVKDYLSVTTVTTTRAAVSIEDCTYSTEV